MDDVTLGAESPGDLLCDFGWFPHAPVYALCFLDVVVEDLANGCHGKLHPTHDLAKTFIGDFFAPRLDCQMQPITRLSRFTRFQLRKHLTKQLLFVLSLVDFELLYHRQLLPIRIRV